MKNFTLISAVITVAVITFFFNNPVFAQGNEKITICHCPPGNPNNCHSITISIDAWAAHLAHPNDYMGPCTDNVGVKLIKVHVAPNPSIEQTTIYYDLCEESIVKMDVYNQTGSKIQTLVNGTKQPGEYSENFSTAISGLYLLNVTAVTPYEVVQSSQVIVEMK